ncbi:hypothetical protein XCR1_1170010 [Xenorhabdus cabanillasii JM26]|uniref:Uncharacterized protein n=1 Tax=Xenorhabdus cabanillasii JM26 TaxID=1427517 RepID=W1INX9_9GAMM|nr:hypothetical protein XCR1_1170010 [Xenorhabdus cabanillasii JM26]
MPRLFGQDNIYISLLRRNRNVLPTGVQRQNNIFRKVGFQCNQQTVGEWPLTAYLSWSGR